jgi:hypothetical protein
MYYLGYFLIQSTLIYIVGIRVFSKLHHGNSISFSGSTMVTLITCVAVVVPAAEIYHRVIVVPSKAFAHKFYDFITS